MPVDLACQARAMGGFETTVQEAQDGEIGKNAKATVQNELPCT
jgi:hypothetical protein